MGRTRVEDGMTAPVLTARVGEPLRAAAGRRLEAGVGGLPVLDPHGRLAGRPNHKDVLRAEVRRPRLTWGSVAQGMPREILTVAPDWRAIPCTAR